MQRSSLLVVALAALLPAILLAGCAGGAADPGTLVVLTHPASGEVRFLQFGSGRITERVKVGGEPASLVRDAVRGRVYVPDRAGDSVAVVDVLTRSIVQRVQVGREPRYAVLSPNGKRLYVSAAGDNELATIDLDSLTVTARVSVGNRPGGVAVSGDGSRVFVSAEGDRTVAVIDSAGGRRMQRPIAVPGGITGSLVLNTDGTVLAGAAAGKPALTTLTLTTRQVREIPLNRPEAGQNPPAALLPTPDGRFWVVAPSGSNELLALPTSADGTPVTVPLDQPPGAIVVAPGGRLLVAGQAGEHITEVDLEKQKVTRRIRVGEGHTDLAVFSKAALDALRGQ